MLCKCHWIVLYIVHVTAFCLGGPFFSGHGVYQTVRQRTNGRGLWVQYSPLVQCIIKCNPLQTDKPSRYIPVTNHLGQLSCPSFRSP